MSMAAGWYPDPFSSAGYLRWWDGTQWTSQTTLPTAMQSTPVVHAPPVAYGGAPQVATFRLASWGQRFLAYLLDALIVACVTAPIYAVVLWAPIRDFVNAVPTDGSELPLSTITTFEERVLSASLGLSLVSLVITFLYFVPQNVAYGRTVGKRAVGIRIRMLAEDRKPDWRHAIYRWGVFSLGAFVGSGLFLLLDCLWPLWDKPWQQALHDKAAGTVVVPSRP